MLLEQMYLPVILAIFTLIFHVFFNYCLVCIFYLLLQRSDIQNCLHCGLMPHRHFFFLHRSFLVVLIVHSGKTIYTKQVETPRSFSATSSPLSCFISKFYNQCNFNAFVSKSILAKAISLL